MEDVPEILKPHELDGKRYSLVLDLLQYRFFRVCDWIYLTLFYLRRTGIKGVVDRIKVHVGIT